MAKSDIIKNLNFKKYTFFSFSIKLSIKLVQDQIKEFKGPSLKERWVHWKHITPEQHARSAAINELEKLNKSFDRLKLHLENDEITAVKKNLQAQKVMVDEEFVINTFFYCKNFFPANFLFLLYKDQRNLDLCI